MTDVQVDDWIRDQVGRVQVPEIESWLIQQLDSTSSNVRLENVSNVTNVEVTRHKTAKGPGGWTADGPAHVLGPRDSMSYRLETTNPLLFALQSAGAEKLVLSGGVRKPDLGSGEPVAYLAIENNHASLNLTVELQFSSEHGPCATYLKPGKTWVYPIGGTPHPDGPQVTGFANIENLELMYRDIEYARPRVLS